MSPSVVQGRPFCGGLEWSKANFGRAGPGPRWDLAWRSANLEKFRLRRSFARGPAPSTPVLEESLDFEARRGKKRDFFILISSGPMWSNVGPMWPLPRHPKWSNVPQNVKSQHWTRHTLMEGERDTYMYCAEFAQVRFSRTWTVQMHVSTQRNRPKVRKRNFATSQCLLGRRPSSANPVGSVMKSGNA